MRLFSALDLTTGEGSVTLRADGGEMISGSGDNMAGPASPIAPP
jgi:hypothetical protein